MTRYAIAPDVIPEGVDYLTPGKRYEISDEGDVDFHIIDDEGDVDFCLKEGCAHIEGDWLIVDEPEPAS